MCWNRDFANLHRHRHQTSCTGRPQSTESAEARVVCLISGRHAHTTGPLLWWVVSESASPLQNIDCDEVVRGRVRLRRISCDMKHCNSNDLFRSSLCWESRGIVRICSVRTDVHVSGDCTAQETPWTTSHKKRYSTTYSDRDRHNGTQAVYVRMRTTCVWPVSCSSKQSYKQKRTVARCFDVHLILSPLCYCKHQQLSKLHAWWRSLRK